MIEKLQKALAKNNYQVFSNDSKPYNLNIVGIRTNNSKPNKFDDKLCVFWNYNGNWNSMVFQVTTDPGTYWLKNPSRVAGTAILKPGQYKGSHIIGKHKGKYTALVQKGAKVSVIRDYDKDEELDFNSDRVETGYFGINIHRSNSTRSSVNVDKWSAGCTVFANPHDFDLFMDLCKQGAANWGEKFTYTLIEEQDIK